MNDGMEFRQEDWARLRRIAEGNPDPQRIGAFGVGFYSLFSICQEPLVSSGDTALGFFWRGDSLYTRRTARPPLSTANHANSDSVPVLPEDQDVNPDTNRPWTTFHMRLREPSPLPETALKLSEFLVTSLAFTSNVQTVEVYWDHKPLLRVHKTLAASDPVAIERTLFPSSPQGMMRADTLEATPVQITGHVAWAILRDEQKRRRAKESLITSIARKISAATTGDASAAVPATGPSSGGGGFLSSTLGSGWGGFFKKALGSSDSPASSKGTSPAPTTSTEPTPLAESSEPQPSSPPASAPPVAAASDWDMVRADVYLRVATATITTKLDKAFVRQLERSTKKPPPTKTKLSIIYTGKADKDKSLRLTHADGTPYPEAPLPEGLEDLFAGLVPHLVRSTTSTGDARMGRVFIGFRTHQTTSFGGHVAARLIPTVERESLDFIDRYCAQWNMELLSMAAWVARAVYENEMRVLQSRWSTDLGTDARWGYAELAPPDPNAPESDQNQVDEAKRQVAQGLFDEALHLMRFFSFGPSTPSSRVGEVMAERFFACSKWTQVRLLSTAGVKFNNEVRWPNAVLNGFVKRVAVLSEPHVRSAPDFMGVLRDRGLVRDLLVEDVMQELASRPLSPEEMVACLKWWFGVSQHGQYASQFQTRLVRTAVVRVPPALGSANGHPDTEVVQPLSSIKYWRNVSRVPHHLPVPPSCLPVQVSQALSTHEMSRAMDWSELPLSTWIEYLVEVSASHGSDGQSLTSNSEFAQQVFSTLARAWGNLKQGEIDAIVPSLQAITCIPTRVSAPNQAVAAPYVFKRPDAAYFASVALFEDLPIVAFPSTSVKGSLEKVLVALGVRKHVELQLIFDRLVSRGNWSHVDLIAYLAENQASLTPLEWSRLRKTAMLPRESNTKSNKQDTKSQRFFPHQLYEPTVAHRALGLPLLAWSGKPWRATSEEAKLLFLIGLQKHPKLETLLELASGSDAEVRAHALRYFIEHFQAVYAKQWSNDLRSHDKFAFIPCLEPSDPRPSASKETSSSPADASGPSLQSVLRPASQAFTHHGATVLGFAVVDQEALRALGTNMGLLPALLTLPHHPKPQALRTQLLRLATTDHDIARKRFDYLATVSDFSLDDYTYLSRSAFVPVERRKGTAVEVVLAPPMHCFFLPKERSEDEVVPRELFQYCDFGSLAGAFLKQCGVSEHPSPEQIATKVVADPRAFYTAMASAEQYIALLRLLGTSYKSFPRPLKEAMRTSPFLLASHRAPVESSSLDKLDKHEEDEDEMEEGALLYDLRCASEIVRVDHASSSMLFATIIYAAPYDDGLLSFYEELGSPKLSSLIEEQFHVLGTPRTNTPRAQEAHAKILERTPLFLYEKASSVKSTVKNDMQYLASRLEVVEVSHPGLSLTRTLRFGSLHKQRTLDASAYVSTTGSWRTQSKIALMVSGSVSIDWFEVAQQLCGVLLAKSNLEEVLLYMSLLITPLRDLRRRGFHVDKILAARKAQREAAERSLRVAQQQAHEAEQKRAHELEQQTLAQSSRSTTPTSSTTEKPSTAGSSSGSGKAQGQGQGQTPPHIPTPTADKPQPPQVDPPPLYRSAEDEKKASAAREKELGSVRSPGSYNNARPTSSLGGSGSGFLNQLRSRWNPHQPLSSLANGTSSILREAKRGSTGPISSSSGGMSGGPVAPPLAGNGSTASSGGGVTPLDQIKDGVTQAVRASQGRGSQLSSTTRGPAPPDAPAPPSEPHQIKEADAYCDPRGSTQNLRLAGTVEGMRVFVSTHLSPSYIQQAEQQQAIERLVTRVYRPVAQLFDMDLGSLCVYLDTDGPTIAFNQAGVVYLNLRFYLAWHDTLVCHNELREPLISTYFTLAHEIAHNVEHGHNSKHEFYFSAIAEQYLPRLVAYLSTI